MSDIKSKKHVKSSWASHSSKVDKSWGVEHRWGCFGSIGAKLLIMEKGGKTSFKMHPLKNEVFYILSGKILLHMVAKYLCKILSLALCSNALLLLARFCACRVVARIS